MSDGTVPQLTAAMVRIAHTNFSKRSSKTVGAVRHVPGDAEVGFWVVCWVARGGARQLAAAGSGSGAVERGRGVVCRVASCARRVWRLFWPAHSPGVPETRFMLQDLIPTSSLEWGAPLAPTGSPPDYLARVGSMLAMTRLTVGAAHPHLGAPFPTTGLHRQ